MEACTTLVKWFQEPEPFFKRFKTVNGKEACTTHYYHHQQYLSILLSFKTVNGKEACTTETLHPKSLVQDSEAFQNRKR